MSPRTVWRIGVIHICHRSTPVTYVTQNIPFPTPAIGDHDRAFASAPNRIDRPEADISELRSSSSNGRSRLFAIPHQSLRRIRPTRVLAPSRSTSEPDIPDAIPPLSTPVSRSPRTPVFSTPPGSCRALSHPPSPPLADLCHAGAAPGDGIVINWKRDDANTLHRTPYSADADATLLVNPSSAPSSRVSVAVSRFGNGRFSLIATSLNPPDPIQGVRHY
ncbi:hypothetical protein B0H10DRAFT_1973319 [Mycena sp. CBHHK59/15]|nr:hypothetical protein B0H10DRAFT_1973319 [Mycena sp. CBHHK59/15]